jgi:hypothetical protein
MAGCGIKSGQNALVLNAHLGQFFDELPAAAFVLESIFEMLHVRC